MLKPFLMVPVLFFFGLPALQQQAPSTPATPAATDAAQAAAPAAPSEAEFMNRVNPVKPTPESQARARQIYSWDCSMCHGDKGDGKGDVAAEQKLTMRDYRDPTSLKQLTDGQMFYIIRYGKGQMPAEGERAKDDEVWNLIIYIRNMSNTQAVSSAAQPPA